MTEQTMIYTVDLGNGQVMDIEGPPGATPEQLQAVVAQQQGGPSVTDENGLYDPNVSVTDEAPVNGSREPIGDTLDSSAKMVAGNMLKGALSIPDLLASGGEAVTNGISSVLGAGVDAILRAHGASPETLDWWSKVMEPQHVQTMGERLDEITPEAAAPGAALGAELLGGALIPFPGASASVPAARFPVAAVKAPVGSKAAQVVASGEKFGIDVPMGATGRGAAIVEKGFDNLPISAGITQAARDKLGQQVSSAVDNVAGTYGPTTSYAGIGEAAQTGAKKWIDRFQQVAGKVYDAIPIKPTTPTKLTNTIANLEGQGSKFSSNPELAAILNNPKFDRYLRALKGTTEDVPTGVLDAAGNPLTRQVQKGGQLSWQDLKDFRSRVGEEIGDHLFSDGTLKSDLRGLYASLSDDMKATAATQGPAALRAFERANDLYRRGQERIDGALVKLLGNDSAKAPEAAAAKIQAIARDGKASADLKTLAEIRSSLPAEEWSQVQNGVIRLLGQPVNSVGREFSPQTFIQTFNDMAPEARNLFFGQGELRKNLDEFAGVIGNLARNNALRNTSSSAPGLTGVGTVGTIAAGLLNPILGAKMASAGAANYGLAKLWTNPKFVQWASGYTKMVNGAARAGQSPAPEKLGTQLQLLGRVAATNPTIAEDVAGLQQRLQQAFAAGPQSLAANPGPRSEDAGTTTTPEAGR